MRILNNIIGTDGGPSSTSSRLAKKTAATITRIAPRRSISVGAAASPQFRQQQPKQTQQKRTRLREARTSKERRALSEIAMRTELPGQFDDACDFEKFVDACSVVVNYIDSVFASATERPLPSGEFATPPDDDEEEEKLRDDMLGILGAFNEYWMTHREEMLSENDLAANDASTARMPTGLVAMTVVSLAEATAAALGAFPTYATATALSFPSVARQLLAQTPKVRKFYKISLKKCQAHPRIQAHGPAARPRRAVSRVAADQSRRRRSRVRQSSEQKFSFL